MPDMTEVVSLPVLMLMSCELNLNKIFADLSGHFSSGTSIYLENVLCSYDGYSCTKSVRSRFTAPQLLVFSPFCILMTI